jgi:DeoR/GlpR family transcriptional regulator of sugar metabolism
MLQTSKTRILLCDSTKLDKVCFSLIYHVNDVDYIVLDSDADENHRDNLRGADARIIYEK